jgi:hypothetical protein
MIGHSTKTGHEPWNVFVKAWWVLQINDRADEIARSNLQPAPQSITTDESSQCDEVPHPTCFLTEPQNKLQIANMSQKDNSLA